jgi:hypothetical protein
VDALRILIPAYLIFWLGVAWFVALMLVYENCGIGITLACAAPLGATAAAIAVAALVALKWGIMRTFRPVIVPLWCSYVWFNELVNGAYESVMGR